MCPEIEVNIDVYCAKCGDGLCNQTEVVRAYLRGDPEFRVSPCETCLQAARDEAYDRGRDEGFEEGFEEARKKFSNDET